MMKQATSHTISRWRGFYTEYGVPVRLVYTSARWSQVYCTLKRRAFRNSSTQNTNKVHTGGAVNSPSQHLAFLVHVGSRPESNQ